MAAQTLIKKFFKIIRLQELGETLDITLDSVRVLFDTTKTYFQFNGRVKASDPVDSDDLTTKSYTETPRYATESFASTVTFNVSSAESQEVNVTGNITIEISNEKNGGTYIFYLNIDSTGGYSITAGTSLGTIDNASTAVTSATADATYIYTVVVAPSGATYHSINPVG